MAGLMVCVMWAAAVSRAAGSASRAGLSSASSATGSARYPASWRMEWSTPTAVGVRPSAASARYRWPSASRVAPIFDSLLRYGLRAGAGHGGHRLEDQALPADVALRRRVGRPQRVLGVGAGSLDEGGEHLVIDALGAGEVGRVDLADLLADGRELLRGAFAGLAARVEGQSVEFIDAEQGGVVRIVAVLCNEIRLPEAGEFSRGRDVGAGHVLS
jgi:hypothetical protein